MDLEETRNFEKFRKLTVDLNQLRPGVTLGHNETTLVDWVLMNDGLLDPEFRWSDWTEERVHLFFHSILDMIRKPEDPFYPVYWKRLATKPVLIRIIQSTQKFDQNYILVCNGCLVLLFSLMLFDRFDRVLNTFTLTMNERFSQKPSESSPTFRDVFMMIEKFIPEDEESQWINPRNETVHHLFMIVQYLIEQRMITVEESRSLLNLLDSKTRILQRLEERMKANTVVHLEEFVRKFLEVRKRLINICFHIMISLNEESMRNVRGENEEPNCMNTVYSKNKDIVDIVKRIFFGFCLNYDNIMCMNKDQIRTENIYPRLTNIILRNHSNTVRLLEFFVSGEDSISRGIEMDSKKQERDQIVVDQIEVVKSCIIQIFNLLYPTSLKLKGKKVDYPQMFSNSFEELIMKSQSLINRITNSKIEEEKLRIKMEISSNGLPSMLMLLIRRLISISLSPNRIKRLYKLLKEFVIGSQEGIEQVMSNRCSRQLAYNYLCEHDSDNFLSLLIEVLPTVRTEVLDRVKPSLIILFRVLNTRMSSVCLHPIQVQHQNGELERPRLEQMEYFVIQGKDDYLMFKILVNYLKFFQEMIPVNQSRYSHVTPLEIYTTNTLVNALPIVMRYLNNNSNYEGGLDIRETLFFNKPLSKVSLPHYNNFMEQEEVALNRMKKKILLEFCFEIIRTLEISTSRSISFFNSVFIEKQLLMGSNPQDHLPLLNKLNDPQLPVEMKITFMNLLISSGFIVNNKIIGINLIGDLRNKPDLKLMVAYSLKQNFFMILGNECHRMMQGTQVASDCKTYISKCLLIVFLRYSKQILTAFFKDMPQEDFKCVKMRLEHMMNVSNQMILKYFGMEYRFADSYTLNKELYPEYLRGDSEKMEVYRLAGLLTSNLYSFYGKAFPKLFKRLVKPIFEEHLKAADSIELKLLPRVIKEGIVSDGDKSKMDINKLILSTSESSSKKSQYLVNKQANLPILNEMDYQNISNYTFSIWSQIPFATQGNLSNFQPLTSCFFSDNLNIRYFELVSQIASESELDFRKPSSRFLSIPSLLPENLIQSHTNLNMLISNLLGEFLLSSSNSNHENKLISIARHLSVVLRTTVCKRYFIQISSICGAQTCKTIIATSINLMTFLTDSYFKLTGVSTNIKEERYVTTDRLNKIDMLEILVDILTTYFSTIQLEYYSPVTEGKLVVPSGQTVPQMDASGTPAPEPSPQRSTMLDHLAHLTVFMLSTKPKETVETIYETIGLKTKICRYLILHTRLSSSLPVTENRALSVMQTSIKKGGASVDSVIEHYTTLHQHLSETDKRVMMVEGFDRFIYSLHTMNYHLYGRCSDARVSTIQIEGSVYTYRSMGGDDPYVVEGVDSEDDEYRYSVVRGVCREYRRVRKRGTCVSEEKEDSKEEKVEEMGMKPISRVWAGAAVGMMGVVIGGVYVWRDQMYGSVGVGICIYLCAMIYLMYRYFFKVRMPENSNDTSQVDGRNSKLSSGKSAEEREKDKGIRGKGKKEASSRDETRAKEIAKYMEYAYYCMREDEYAFMLLADEEHDNCKHMK